MPRRHPMPAQPANLVHAVALAALTMFATAGYAAPDLASTSDALRWQVAVNLNQPDGQLSSFQTAHFQDAVSIVGRDSGGIGWIANTTSGSNAGWVGNWTFFVFRQTFDLTGYDPSTAVLSFQWAADDSGQRFADRGSWVPTFRLNGGDFQSSAWVNGHTYDLSAPVTVNSGFVSGLNVIDFYVEGNGVTDGFALKPLSFTATPVPEASTVALTLVGLVVIAGAARRRLAGSRTW